MTIGHNNKFLPLILFKKIIKLLIFLNLFPKFINIEILSLPLLVWVLEAYRRAVP